MIATVHLKDTRTGEVKVIDFNCRDLDEDSTVWLWIEGNLSCDCNRSWYFFDENESKRLPCNSEVIEVVKIVRKESGAVLYEV